MREIKFRAWYADKWYWFSLAPKASFMDIYENFERLGQYTGLKDKNGKEIYEGDIVTCADLGPLDMPLIKRTGYIEYADNACTFGVWVDWTEFGTSNDGEARALWPMGNFRLSEYEVIGNIYENSDLLK